MEEEHFPEISGPIDGYEIRDPHGQLVCWWEVDAKEGLILFRYYPDRVHDERLRIVVNSWVTALKTTAHEFHWALFDYDEIKRELKRLVKAQKHGTDADGFKIEATDVVTGKRKTLKARRVSTQPPTSGNQKSGSNRLWT